MEFSILNLLLVLVVAWTCGLFARRLGYPEVLGELAAGIIFGPALLGILYESDSLKILAELGVFLMMFYIGMEVDHLDLKKSSKAGLLASIGGFIFPFVFGYLSVMWFGGTFQEAIFVAIAVSVTSLATKSRILVDLKLIGTRIASVLISGALISDTAAIIIFATVVSIFESGSFALGNLAAIIVKSSIFFLITIYVGLKIFPYIGKKLSEYAFTQRTTSFTIILLMAFAFGEFAELAGLHSIIGAFMAGLFIRKDFITPKLSLDIASLFKDISIGFLAPIFFVLAGFHVSLGVFQTDLLLMVTIIGLATIGKILGTALFYLPSGYGWREGLTIGAGMNGRGAVEIIIAEIALEMGLISKEIFSILVFMAFFTTATVPVLLKWCVAWLKRRDELVYSDDGRKDVIIIGAGPTARTLASEYSKYSTVTLADSNKQNCEEAYKEGLKVIYGNALHEETLDSCNVMNAKTVIVLTGNPEVNVLVSQLVRESYLVPEVYTLIGPAQKENFKDVIEKFNLIPFSLAKNKLIQWDWLIKNDKVKTTKIIVDEETELSFFNNKEDFLPLLVMGKNKTNFYHSVEMLRKDDEVWGLSLQ